MRKTPEKKDNEYVKTVPSFITSDGKLFPRKDLALFHECATYLCKVFDVDDYDEIPMQAIIDKAESVHIVLQNYLLARALYKETDEVDLSSLGGDE